MLHDVVVKNVDDIDSELKVITRHARRTRLIRRIKMEMLSRTSRWEWLGVVIAETKKMLNRIEESGVRIFNTFAKLMWKLGLILGRDTSTYRGRTHRVSNPRHAVHWKCPL
jgi:hypothetical protein